MLDVSPSRRCFLKVLAHAGAVAGTAAAGFGCNALPAQVAAGNVKNLPVGTLQTVASESLAIGRDAGGLYAMTLICPHASCDMSSQGSVSSAGIVCSCHGSTFDVNGAVTGGPAHSALEHYAVTLSAAGDATIETTQTVAATTRTAVPAALG